MKAIYKGIDCGRLKRGDEVEIEMLDWVRIHYHLLRRRCNRKELEHTG